MEEEPDMNFGPLHVHMRHTHVKMHTHAKIVIINTVEGIHLTCNLTGNCHLDEDLQHFWNLRNLFRVPPNDFQHFFFFHRPYLL